MIEDPRFAHLREMMTKLRMFYSIFHLVVDVVVDVVTTTYVACYKFIRRRIVYVMCKIF